MLILNLESILQSRKNTSASTVGVTVGGHQHLSHIRATLILFMKNEE